MQDGKVQVMSTHGAINTTADYDIVRKIPDDNEICVNQENANILLISSNKSKYKNKPFTEVRGYVITDYQKQLEAEWVKELREKSKIEIKEKELKKFKKIYNQ